MKRVILAAMVIGLLCGCQHPLRLKNEGKTQAYERWSQARARVTTGVAEEHLKVEQLEKAEASAREALALHQDYVPARLVLAKVLLRQGNYAGAIEELRIVEVMKSNDPEVAYLVGTAQEKRGELQEALKAYQKARALDPSSDAYVAASVEVLVQMNQPARALELLEARLSRRDASAGLLGLAGEVASMMGLHKQAAGYFQACLDAAPDSPSAREGAAKSHFFAGNYAEALELLGTLRDQPEYREKASWVHLMIGDCHMTLNHPQKARDAYQEAAGIEPQAGRVWASLAKAALALGDVPGATRAARQAVSLGAEGVEASLVLAYGLRQQGDVRGAIELLDAADRKHPNNATVLCMLGRCYENIGRSDEAASCYLKVLRGDPNHALARRLLATTGVRSPQEP